MSPRTARWVKRFKKYHKWPGIIISLSAFFFALSGIILNHRDLISSVDFSRRWMPDNYLYRNWNLSSMKSSVVAAPDTVLFYGNMGAWLADSNGAGFRDFNRGFPDGIDMRKIYSVVKFRHHLVAGTHFGLYINTLQSGKWLKVPMPEEEERISDLATKGDTMLILSRNHLFGTTDLEHLFNLHLPDPRGYDHRAGLFLTLWNLHSGELFGFAGMIFVDLLGLVLIFLTVTGLLHFLFPKWINRAKSRKKSFATQLRWKKLNLEWHNLAGWVFGIFLIINVTAGMFLRPPLLIPIASSQVGILPGSNLDNGNPWHDKLRRIAWNEQDKTYLLYTSDGFFVGNERLDAALEPAGVQPVVSIMGCNVLEPDGKGGYLVGSFSGLYSWNPASGAVLDYFTGQPAERPSGIGRPVGQNMVAGFLKDVGGRSFWIDYNRGVVPFDEGAAFPQMTDEILEKCPISLWNAALEVHTGRILEKFIGPFYLLYVPLVGLSVLVVLISGILMWWLAYRKKKK